MNVKLAVQIKKKKEKKKKKKKKKFSKSNLIMLYTINVEVALDTPIAIYCKKNNHYCVRVYDGTRCTH